MATRYWVGGTGTWSSSSTTNWSASSGGASGASVPTSADDVVFDENSGGGTATTASGGGALNCKSLTFTVGYSGTFAHNNITLNVYGSITLSSSATYQIGGIITCAATTAGNTITSNGKSFVYVNNGGITFNGSGGEWILQDALNTGTITLSQGTLRTNDKSVSARLFLITGSSTRACYLGASNITLSGASPQWDATTATNLTFDAGTSTITLTASSNFVTFNGGSLTYNTIDIQTTVKFYGSNVVNTLTCITPDVFIYFEVGTVTSVTNWGVSLLNGTVTVKSTATSFPFEYEIEKLGGGTVTASGLLLANCLGYPASTWNAINSVDSGGNTNWTFLSTPSSGSIFALL